MTQEPEPPEIPGRFIYVNGDLAAKFNIANLEHDRHAMTSINAEEETIVLPVELFQRGTNIMGVMVKQAGKTSPDLYFDLELEVDALP